LPNNIIHPARERRLAFRNEKFGRVMMSVRRIEHAPLQAKETSSL